MEDKQENVDVPKSDSAEGRKAALENAMAEYKKYKAGDFVFEDVPYEDRVNLEVNFRIAGSLVPEDDFDLAEFRKKNMISIGL